MTRPDPEAYLECHQLYRKPAGVEAECIKLEKSASELELGAVCYHCRDHQKSCIDPGATRTHYLSRTATTFSAKCGSRGILLKKNTIRSASEPIGLSLG